MPSLTPSPSPPPPPPPAPLAPAQNERDPFGSFPTTTCPGVNEITQDVAKMRNLWEAAGGTMSNSFGMPDLLVVKVSFPGDVAKFKAYVNKIADLHHGKDMSVADDDYGGGAGKCRSATLVDSVDVEVRVVEAPDARAGAWSVEEFAGYVDSVHERWTGYNWGWDHWLDHHFGFTISSRPLDQYVTKLRNANVSYCARTGIGGGPVDSGCTEGCTEGSLWTGGVSGQGIQLHGEFDFSVLEKNSTSGLDYCATPATTGVTKRVADHDRWRRCA